MSKRKLLIVGNPNSRVIKRMAKDFSHYDVTIVDQNSEESLSSIKGDEFDSLFINEVQAILKHIEG